MLEVIVIIAYVVIAALLGVMTYQVYKAIKLFTPPVYASKLGHEVDLPSVTVCIPARNEQHALTDCLQKVVASTYQRLEIIVLDDVSGDDTSALIKSFASEGVRFVQGKPLTKGWLGKNHALQGLLEQASGTLILFMDVDTRLSPNAIENAVRYATSQRASMVSVLPRREDGWRGSVIASPLRYFWEIIFHRKLWPASASNAWLIRRDVLLERFKGFESFKHTIQPESKIAAELAQTNEYRFLMSTENFGVAYEKKWRSQLLTSVRLLFPLLGNQGALSIIALLDLLVLLVPFIMAIAMFMGGNAALGIAGFVLGVAFCALYGWYAHRIWNKGWFIGALLWPVLLIQEFVLIIASFIKYKRQTVTWKGRKIQPEVQS